MDENLNTGIEGLHCLGDSSGWTRGLMMASVMGTIMGRRLAGLPDDYVPEAAQKQKTK